MGSHIFEIWGLRIFWQVGSLGIKNIGRFAYKYESKVRVLHSVQQMCQFILKGAS